MFYYNDHPRTPSFSNGLIKTKSGFFFDFSDLTCHFEDTGIDVFSLYYAAW